MNALIGVALFALLAATLIAAGVQVGIWYQRDRESLARAQLQIKLEAVTGQRDDARMMAEKWSEEATRATHLAQRLVVAQENRRARGEIAGDEEIEDPPTTGQADRRYLAQRRVARERETSDTRIAVRVADDEAMPAPALRDAADDH